MRLDPRSGSAKKFTDSWTIRIRPMSDANMDYFKHTLSTSGGRLNRFIPSGVTGKYVMDLFLHDDINKWKFMENSNRIQHEICHANLIGTKEFVKGVHNKIGYDGAILKGFTFPFWTNRWRIWETIPIRVIDVRDEIISNI